MYFSLRVRILGRRWKRKDEGWDGRINTVSEFHMMKMYRKKREEEEEEERGEEEEEEVG